MEPKEKQVYRKEIEIGGDLTWAILRQTVDDLLRENNLPAEVKIDYLDWSQGSSYGQLMVVIDGQGLTVA